LPSALSSATKAAAVFPFGMRTAEIPRRVAAGRALAETPRVVRVRRTAAEDESLNFTSTIPATCSDPEGTCAGIAWRTARVPAGLCAIPNAADGRTAASTATAMAQRARIGRDVIGLLETSGTNS
jgi:hypothetical protein